MPKKRTQKKSVSSLIILVLILLVFGVAAVSVFYQTPSLFTRAASVKKPLQQVYCANGETQHFFPETGQTVRGVFLKYWCDHGRLEQQGYPISPLFREVTANGVHTVQYFERAVFQYQPQNDNPQYQVLLALLGNDEYKRKYPQGAPAQTAHTSGGVFYPQTGHWLGGKFRAYWEAHGGLAQQGYPISDEFTQKSDLDGKTYTVQYFERAVFELHPENAGTPYEVLLSQLGTFTRNQQYARGFPDSIDVPKNKLIVGLQEVYSQSFSPDDALFLTVSQTTQPYVSSYLVESPGHTERPCTTQEQPDNTFGWHCVFKDSFTDPTSVPVLVQYIRPNNNHEVLVEDINGEASLRIYFPDPNN